MVYCFTHIRWFDSSEFRLGLVTFALLLGLGLICSESFLSGQWFFVFYSNVLFQFTFGHLSTGWGPHESTNLRQVATTASGSTRPAWSRLSPSTARIRCSIWEGFDRCFQGVGEKYGGSPMKFAFLCHFTGEITGGNMIHQILGCESHVTFQSLWLLGEHGNWNSMTTCHRPLLKCENQDARLLKSFDSYPQNPKIDKTYTSADVLISPL